jgi:hypothetical protein
VKLEELEMSGRRHYELLNNKENGQVCAGRTTVRERLGTLAPTAAAAAIWVGESIERRVGVVAPPEL